MEPDYSGIKTTVEVTQTIAEQFTVPIKEDEEDGVTPTKQLIVQYWMYKQGFADSLTIPYLTTVREDLNVVMQEDGVNRSVLYENSYDRNGKPTTRRHGKPLPETAIRAILNTRLPDKIKDFFRPPPDSPSVASLTVDANNSA